MQVLLGNDGLYTLDSDRIPEWNAVRQPRLTAPCLPVVFSPLSHEVAEPSRKERPKVERPKLIELDDEDTVVRSPATTADVELSLKDYQPPLYKAVALQLGFANSLSVKKKSHRRHSQLL